MLKTSSTKSTKHKKDIVGVDSSGIKEHRDKAKRDGKYEIGDNKIDNELDNKVDNKVDDEVGKS